MLKSLKCASYNSDHLIYMYTDIVISHLDRPNGILFGCECYEGAALALAHLIPEHGALLDGAVAREKLPHIGFRKFFIQHANKKFALCKKQKKNKNHTIIHIKSSRKC